jgi:hypothetical protein
VGGLGAAALSPEDFGAGAGAGGAVSLLAPPLVSKFAGAVGGGLDWLTGQMGNVRAGRILRESAGDSLNALQQAMQAAPEGVPASRIAADLNVPVVQAALRRAEMRDPKGVTNAFREQEGQDLANELARIAGGPTAETARAARETTSRSLQNVTAPLREEAFADVARTNVALPKLDQIATKARAAVEESVDLVRKSERQIAAAEDWARSWAPGGARQPGAPIPPVARTYPGELAQRAEQAGAGAAAESLRAGGMARAAENTSASMKARGLEPIQAPKLTTALDSLLKNPEIGTNREASQAITRINQMLGDWADQNGIISGEALYAIRKNGVSGVIRELNPGMDAKAQDRLAAKVLSDIKPLFDDAMVKAGAKGWPDYLDTFSQGAKEIKNMELAAQIQKLYAGGKGSAADKQQIVDIIAGNAPDVVEDILGSGRYKIGTELAKDMPFFRKLANALDLDAQALAQAAKGKPALTEQLKSQEGWKLRFPFFTRASTAVNEIASELENRVSAQTMNALIRSARTGKNFNEVIKVLPTAERNAVLRVLRTPADWNRFSTGVATAAAGTQTVEPRNALAPESQNALAE